MKTFAKLSLLLALIIVGRTLRSTEPAAGVVTPVAQSEPVLFDAYSAALPIAPVSHRTAATVPSDTLSLTWF